ncbi:MAG: nitroreductase family protein [Lactimicrobium sp.]|jgi:nitroreductase|uniref:nitroreductase family protein n=1 Tax=Lactimicrobium sp. TaxID=2563780 RepID=UPI002F34F96F
MNMHELMVKDRSIRKFLQKPIPDQDLDEILENVRLAHCGNNRQRLRYVLVTSRKMCDQVAGQLHYAALLKGAGQPKKEEEPAAYLVILVPVENAATADIDAGIASEVITASAAEKGIAACILMNFNRQKMNEILGVDPSLSARLVVSLGYPMITSTVEEAGDDLAYHVDQEGNYHVPKLSVDRLVTRK